MTVGLNHRPYPPARVYIHDGNGRLLFQLPEAWADRTFATMTAGRCLITVPENEPLLDRCLPEEGRIAVVKSSIYPLMWAGVVANMEGRPGDGAIDLECRGYESVFQERYLPTDFSPNGTAGAVVRQIHEAIEAENPTGVDLGEIAGGNTFEETNYGDRSAFDSFTLVAKQSGNYEWWLEHEVARGQLRSAVHFQPARGQDQTNVAVLEGGTAYPTVRVLRWRQGAEGSVHRVRAIAGATSGTQAFTARSRVNRSRGSSAPIAAVSRVAAAMLRHGFNFTKWPTGSSIVRRAEAVAVFENIRGLATLTTAAESYLQRGKVADRAIDLEVWGSAHLWERCLPGDVVRLKLPRPAFVKGYDGPVAIVSTQPLEHMGLLHMVVEVPSAY